MGLRLKFLILLLAVPSICLGSFLYFALSTFVADKTASAYETQLELLGVGSMVLARASSSDMATPVKELLDQEAFSRLLVADANGIVRYARDATAIGKSVGTLLGQNAYEKLVSQKAGEGSFETIDSKPLLVSFLSTQLQGNTLLLLLSQSKTTAVRASLLFFYKAVATFVALIAFAALASLLFSNRLTRGLVLLSEAMSQFGQFQRDVVLPRSTSNDEVGRMTSQFQRMRDQIKALIVEKQKAAGIETEMKLAGELQRRFFPEAQYQTADVDFAAYFEPANNAGGDWWFRFEANGLFVFLIGDVTGHGLNAAMLTGVCRSAMSLIEGAYTDPASSMTLLNRAFFDSAKRQLNMTCVICELDPKTGILRWASASHEAPMKLPAGLTEIKLRDLVEVIGVNGPRLGEVREVVYQNGNLQMDSGDVIFLYTDGLPDLVNPAQKAFGTRGIVRSLARGFQTTTPSRELIDRIRTNSEDHREGAELVDDVSYLIVKWSKSA